MKEKREYEEDERGAGQKKEITLQRVGRRLLPGSGSMLYHIRKTAQSFLDFHICLALTTYLGNRSMMKTGYSESYVPVFISKSKREMRVSFFFLFFSHNGHSLYYPL